MKCISCSWNALCKLVLPPRFVEMLGRVSGCPDGGWVLSPPHSVHFDRHEEKQGQRVLTTQPVVVKNSQGHVCHQGQWLLWETRVGKGIRNQTYREIKIMWTFVFKHYKAKIQSWKISVAESTGIYFLPSVLSFLLYSFLPLFLISKRFISERLWEIITPLH